MNELLNASAVDRTPVVLNATMIVDNPSSGFELLDPSERSDMLGRAYDEFCDLTEGGRAIDPDEFCARFPAFRTSLAKLLRCHRELEENPELCEQIDIRWPEPGEEFLGYGLIRELGRGTFARAYLAYERAVGDRLVALKLTAHKDAEAHTLGKLGHPNVVPILSAQYDVGSGFRYVVMPYLGSTTLGDVLDYFGALNRMPATGRDLLQASRDPLWPAENVVAPPDAMARGSHVDAVVHIVERLADALAAVHGRGFLHRDLKPSNVLLTPNGVPVLIDFNLALDKAADGVRLGGTLPYMPPEQLRAMSGGARPQAGNAGGDIYALGVIAYELLSGSHPFGPVPARLTRHEARNFLLERIDQGPRRLRDLNPAIDARLEALVLRCIASDPKIRPASAADLAAELRRHHMRHARPQRSRALLVAASIAALSLGVGVSAFARVTPPAALGNTTTSPDDHFLAGRFEDAARGYSVALTTEPDQPEVLLQRGKALHKLGRTDEALVDFAKAGDAQYAKGKFQLAIEAYAESLTTDPKQTSIYYRRGRAFQQLGLTNQAIFDFQKANPAADGKVAACLGACRAAERDYSNAIVAFNDAIQNGLDTAEVYADKAYCLSRLGKHGQAEQFAQLALEKSPNLTAALYTRAHARRAQAGSHPHVDLRPAIEDMRRVFALQQDGTADQYLLAAHACALKLEYSDGVDTESLSEEGQRYTKEAVLHGMSVDLLTGDPLVGKWAKSLNGLTGVARPKTPDDGRLVDPLHGRMN
ncbi:MAG: protein kinase [Gemmataceae bacterium]